ncbi:hypothetical protein OEA41_000699 [Lepraria neglecta]|uniref:Urea carboxylase n=1 Tax=Lepraria neglecta TaxID=209136 RepID=A0AAD9ZIX9_9LECA|nr:hypothetical protein OEA41_000699 [Lepraria neglecta]
MEHLKTLLIANRAEIATRILKTARKLGIRTIAIYTEPDAASTHVSEADVAVLLPGSPAKAYIDGDEIIRIAKEHKADAVIPGYGFLSENADFARDVAAAGMAWVGPSPESIEAFGIKHTARELALKAGVPIVPGTQGLIASEEDAVKESGKLGFPVMLKATAGGGGMGLSIAHNAEEVKNSFATVKSRGENLFKNSGMFIERFYPDSHHIEVQVFGNGVGNAIHFGERECSIQRRHQKVIEECPSPFVVSHLHLREGLCSAAVRLAESIKYGSAGTVEYLVDDKTGNFFFLEMNTRLQVEHGITELCYDVDLVRLMLRQADAQLAGKGGIGGKELEALQPKEPKGAAIEARVYAENPARDYAPSPGTLQIVDWAETDDGRIDTWVHTGTVVSSYYDPLLAKVMVHRPSRDQSIKAMSETLSKSRICGPPTNLDFLVGIVEDHQFATGVTMTNFLTDFKYSPTAIDVISGGAYTQVQDYPGRPTMGRGFPHSGPMDPLAFQIANLLVGNPRGTAGLECTLDGPELLFLGAAVVSICGAPMETKLDGKPVSMWTRLQISAGQKLKIGKTTGGGCRSYLAIYGGLPSVAEWFGSKATSPGVAVGGYQGRQLAAGDLLAITRDAPEFGLEPLALPESIIPRYPSHWDIYAMVGPYEEGYLLPEDVEMIYETKWQISHNAARGGIRLIGPKPKWARPDGGEGGAHPSNVVEYGYPVGALNWTGDDPCIFPIDCPDFGGFVSSTTIIKADYWRLGQMKAGNTMQYKKVALEDALALRMRVNEFIWSIEKACLGNGNLSAIEPLDYTTLPPSAQSGYHGKAVVQHIEAKGNQPQTFYRQGGDDYILVEYGDGTFNLNHRCRVTALIKALKESKTSISFSNGLINTVGCCTSLLIYYDGTKIPQSKFISYLVDIEAQLGDLSQSKVPSRIFKLPIAFDHAKEKNAIKRYMETQRPYASYLPDNLGFVAKNNGFKRKDLVRILTQSKLITVSVGFFAALPLCLPVDPRERMNCPKMNPSRVFTPEGQVSWGGSCMALYNVESPGGYQLTGLTIPGCDYLGSKKHYSLSRPWLFEDFDQLTYYEVDEAEYERQLALFHSGRYEYQIEETVFDMAEHNKLLEDTKDEVAAIRQKQKRAQDEMQKLEDELMAKWTEEKAAGKIPMDKVEALLNDPGIEKISSPLNANVWKVVAEEGQEIKEGDEVAILEAMKLEISVRAEEGMKGKLEKLLVRPGDVVNAGDPLVLVRKG